VLYFRRRDLARGTAQGAAGGGTSQEGWRGREMIALPHKLFRGWCWGFFRRKPT
jgi:hypothetical protein